MRFTHGLAPQVLALLMTASSLASADSTAASSSASSSSVDVGNYCCSFLKLALGSKVSFPSSTSYSNSLSSYWSQQEEAVTPSCIFSPSNTKDVSEAVAILSGLSLLGSGFDVGCNFAIRSGGHTPWAGAANIDSGVTIDMTAISQVTVSSDQSRTSVGPGARWVDVYLKLDALSLSVPGGRVSSVGVGGLVTGGGISFYSGRYGFVCDSVLNFEVVLASGQIVNANATSYPDLWSALKGGSNNFGVVTRIDLKTFSQGKFWGGFIGYTIDTVPQQLKAFVDFAGQASYDVYSALINSYSYSLSQGGWIVANNYEYTKPIAYPPVFQEYTSITPEIFNTMRISNLSDFTIELNGRNDIGNRQLFYTSTYKNDLTMLTQLFQQANSSLQPVKNVAGLTWSLSLQPLPTAITKFGASTGGNSLGLDTSDGNLALALLTATWTSASDDAAMTAASLDLFAKANAYATAHNYLNPYIYLNYAYKTQKPITGYGSASVAKLKSVSKKYDPLQIFQQQVPGGFKLGLA